VADNWDDDTTATGLEPTAEGTLPKLGRKRACLTVLTGTAVGQIFKLARTPGTIGRGQRTEVRLIDEGVSRQHAKFRLDGENLYIEDLGSRNGTFVNGIRIAAETPLVDGDKIQVGRTTVLRFAFHDELDESFHENLMSSALRDPATRLFNKRYLLDRLDSELKFARRHETALSLLMIDIDHFKKTNDTHGHLAGDAVLANLAAVVLRAVRNEDVVARFGGEELAIILRAIPIDPAAHLGERLRKLVEATVTKHGDRELRMTVSIGVATFPATKAETVEQLIEAADKALYRAKDAGRNRVVCATSNPAAK